MGQGGGILTQVFHRLGPGLGGHPQGALLVQGPSLTGRSSGAHLSCITLPCVWKSILSHFVAQGGSPPTGHSAPGSPCWDLSSFPVHTGEEEIHWWQKVFRERDLVKVPHELIPLHQILGPHRHSGTARRQA